jgi:cytoskeletal protein RodZ
MKRAQKEHLTLVDQKIDKNLEAGDKKQNRFYLVVGILAFVFVGMFSFVGVKAIQFASAESAHEEAITNLEQSDGVIIKSNDAEFTKVYAKIEEESEDLQKQLNQILVKSGLITRGTVIK